MGRGSEPKHTYLSVVKGKITERLGTSDKRAETFTDEEVKRKYPSCNRTREIIKDDVFKKTVFEHIDDFVDGIITKISFRDGDFGREINIALEDASESFHLQFQADSAIARAFMQTIPQADPLSVVKFRPWNKGDGMTVSQGGEALNFTWTKEEPGDYPPPPQFAIDGKDYDKWTSVDKDEYKIYKIKRDRFLQDYLENVVAPKYSDENLKDANIEEATHQDNDLPEVPEGNAEKEEGATDDLPF